MTWCNSPRKMNRESDTKFECERFFTFLWKYLLKHSSKSIVDKQPYLSIDRVSELNYVSKNKLYQYLYYNHLPTNSITSSHFIEKSHLQFSKNFLCNSFLSLHYVFRYSLFPDLEWLYMHGEETNSQDLWQILSWKSDWNIIPWFQSNIHFCCWFNNNSIT